MIKTVQHQSSEAHYKIGLCYTLTDNKQDAKDVFQTVIETYPEDKMAVAYATYGLAWVVDQEMEHEQAIKILDGIIVDKDGDDKLQASALLKRGGIYLYKMGDREKARQDFFKLVELYPDTRAANMSFVKEMTQQERGRK